MRKSLIDLDDARKQINEFAQYYNTKSLHSSMFYLTPDDFLNDRINEKLKKRNTKLQLAKKLVTRWKMSVDNNLKQSTFSPYLINLKFHSPHNQYSI